MNKNILSSNCIEMYFEILPSNALKVDHLLQVISYSEQPIPNKKSMYILTLSDSLNSYNSFLMQKKETINLYDIIRILEINVLESKSKQTQPRILIVQYEIFESSNGLIGQPQEIDNSKVYKIESKNGRFNYLKLR